MSNVAVREKGKKKRPARKEGKKRPPKLSSVPCPPKEWGGGNLWSAGKVLGALFLQLCSVVKSDSTYRSHH